MKRNNLFVIILSLIILPALFFTGCNKNNEVTSPNELNYDSPQYAIIGYSDVLNGVEDATLDKDMACNSSIFSYGFLNMSNFVQNSTSNMMSMAGGGDRWLIKFDWGKHLGLLLRRLNLTDDQKTKIKGFVQSYHDGMKPLVQQFRDANADIVKAANAERRTIVEDLKAGKITRQEAQEKIRALNERTKNAVENNTATKSIKDQMCTLRKNLFSNIRSVLTGDQVTKWDTAISLIPDPCK